MISSFLPTTSPSHSHKGVPSFSWNCPHVLSRFSHVSLRPYGLSPPGSSVHGILQARVLEWVAMPASMGSSQPRIECKALRSPSLAGRIFTTSATWEAPRHWCTPSLAIRNRMYFKSPSDATFSPGSSSLTPGPAPGRSGCFLICAPTDLKQP